MENVAIQVKINKIIFDEFCVSAICKPKIAATVCRKPQGSCDLPEFCDGRNPNCPADFFIQNGLKCPDGKNHYCYEGICGSRDQGCQAIWGTDSKDSVSRCYAFNGDNFIYKLHSAQAHTGTYICVYRLLRVWNREWELRL